MTRKQNKIKVVIGINDLAIGGAQKLLVDQLQFFDTARFELHIISLMQSTYAENFCNNIPENIKVHSLSFKGFRDVSSWISFLKILRRIQPDLIISNLFFSNTVFRVAKIFFRYRVIITEHNTYLNRSFLQKVANYILSFLTYKIVAVSNRVADFTSESEKIKRKKFTVIYNGINIAEAQKKILQLQSKGKDALKEELGFSCKDKFIINVARLAKQKNQRLLIEAFYEFQKSVSGYKLIILGKGGQEKNLKEQIRSLNIEEKVFLVGLKKNVYDYYMISDFSIISSKFEGFGIVGIEAMACGLPVISTKVAGPDEYIKHGENGFLVNSDPKDMAKAMFTLSSLSNKTRIKMANMCRETSLNYDIKKSVKEYEQLFEKCFHNAF